MSSTASTDDTSTNTIAIPDFTYYNPFLYIKGAAMLPTSVVWFVTFWWLTPFLLVSLFVEILDLAPVWSINTLAEENVGAMTWTDLWVNMQTW